MGLSPNERVRKLRRACIAIALLGGCAQGGDGSDGVPREGAGDDAAKGDVAREVATPDDAGDAAELEAGDATIFDAIDDAPCSVGATTSCVTSCGTPGTSTCVAGDWARCAPMPGDPCTGLDCTGKGDGKEHTYWRDADGDGFGDAKAPSAACAAPPSTASNNTDCDDTNAAVHPGAPEVCDRVDNDCDGKADEGLHVAAYDVDFSVASPCALADHAACKLAAYDWCRAKSSCYDGGFGPVELAAGGVGGRFICVEGGTLSTGWTEVNAAQPACSSDSMAGRRVCESAVHRAAKGKSYGSGILQTHAPFDWHFLGFAGERVKEFGGVPFAELTAQHSGCRYGTEDSWDCNAAVSRWCTAKGFPTGYGPVEYNSTDVALVCVVP